MTRDELIALLPQELKGLADDLESADYSNACDDASRDTGWSFPVSTDFQIKWQKERAKRALYAYLRDDAASDFQYKAVKIDQRFEHFNKLIKEADEKFEEAQAQNPEEFAGVSAFATFGTKIDAGFAYEPQTGRDRTYDEDQLVITHPNENS